MVTDIRGISTRKVRYAGSEKLPLIAVGAVAAEAMALCGTNPCATIDPYEAHSPGGSRI